MSVAEVQLLGGIENIVAVQVLNRKNLRCRAERSKLLLCVEVALLWRNLLKNFREVLVKVWYNKLTLRHYGK